MVRTLITPMAANIIIVKMHMYMCVRKCQKMQLGDAYKKSGFQVCTDGGDIGCDRNICRRGEVYICIVAASVQ